MNLQHMNEDKRSNQTATEALSEHPEQLRRISIAEARRKAFEASAKAQESQVEYAEEEAERWYNYEVEE